MAATFPSRSDRYLNCSKQLCLNSCLKKKKIKHKGVLGRAARGRYPATPRTSRVKTKPQLRLGLSCWLPSAPHPLSRWRPKRNAAVSWGEKEPYHRHREITVCKTYMTF